MRGPTAIFRRSLFIAGYSAWLLCSLVFAGGDPATAPERARGLPFIRSYPLDEIGNVPRGLRLGFDEFGRLAVMYDGIYTVLNDTTWVDRVGTPSAVEKRMTTLTVTDGRYYYGGRGSWGEVEVTPDGRFKPRPLVPADAPDWTKITPFNKIIGTSTGVYFYELKGVVYWDFARKRNSFYAMPRLTTLFTVGPRVFASCDDERIREILPEQETSRLATNTGLEGQVVSFAAPLDPSHTLLALRSGQLMIFDGQTAVPWRTDKDHPSEGRITAMERLVEGGVAIAVAGKGIRLYDADASLRWALDLPELEAISFLASGEPGVLWAAGGSAIQRIFYDSPQTSFSVALGANAIWPSVAQWNDKTLVCAGNSLFEIAPAAKGCVSTVRTIAERGKQPSPHIATSGNHLLVGNANGVFSVRPDDQITPLISIESVAALEFVSPEICLVIGSREITALRYADGQWTECARRIQGVGDAPIHVEKSPSAREPNDVLWIELGGDQVARLTLRDQTLHLQQLTLPWSGGQWANIGRIDDIVIISSAAGQRAYFDETNGVFCQAPHLDKLLNKSPYWILHCEKDTSGTIWAAHSQGVVTFTPKDNDYVVDATTFELRNDSYPAVKILPGDDIWITAGKSLYHVEPRERPSIKTPQLGLVSLISDQQNLELLRPEEGLERHPTFSFDDNSLRFRFFSGTYAWITPRQYQYRLGPSEPWRPLDPSMVLNFPRLQDGAYRLEVRPSMPKNTGEIPFTFAFTISPPWYRTPACYTLCGAALLLALVATARWINHRSLKQNAKLERIVQARTRELQAAMEKLGEETRHAATLAERSRLAGEIHDSLQQGLSGAILLLDTAMANPQLAPTVREQLNLMRGMLSYSREEVQQAVWDLASPFLQNATLGEALRKIATYINSGATKIDIIVSNEPLTLDPMVQHNLLRIAQEAITNAVKHAEARRIEVSLHSDSTAVVLRVSDDGRGFDSQARTELQGHFGLRGLRARAKTIRAQLQITSTPGTGSTIQVTTPINTTHRHDTQDQ